MTHKYVTQIYEVATPDEAVALAKLGVGNIGSVIVSEQEWQQPTIKDTVIAAQGAGAKSIIIPLFNDNKCVLNVINYYHPDIIHFCEALVGFNDYELDKLVELQLTVRSEFPGIKIMRSIPIAQRGFTYLAPTMELANRFSDASDYFLTDTYLTKSTFVGITGKTCDWDIAANLVRESKIPVFLAGGISPENTYEALVYTKPFGIDSCTLTNQLDEYGKPIRFKKDLDKVAHFISEVRKAEKEL